MGDIKYVLGYFKNEIEEIEVERETEKFIYVKGRNAGRCRYRKEEVFDTEEDALKALVENFRKEEEELERRLTKARRKTLDAIIRLRKLMRGEVEDV